MLSPLHTHESFELIVFPGAKLSSAASAKANFPTTEGFCRRHLRDALYYFPELSGVRFPPHNYLFNNTPSAPRILLSDWPCVCIHWCSLQSAPAMLSQMGQRARSTRPSLGPSPNACVLISAVKMFIHGPIRECTGASPRNNDKAHGRRQWWIRPPSVNYIISYPWVVRGCNLMNFDGGGAIACL